jgi:adenylate cyclase
MRERGVGVLDVAAEYELPIWMAVGTVLLGAAKTDLGHLDDGLAEIRDGIDQYQGLRSPPVFWPLLLYVRARACARADRTAEGLDFIDQALAISGETGTLPPLFLAMKGELLGSDGAGWFRRGLDEAVAVGARSLQLRAAVGLYRVQPTDEHKELLRTAYATFSEGFETPDLRVARELLD